MYVVAKHRIKDAERFFSLSQVAAESAPAGVYGRQFCPAGTRQRRCVSGRRIRSRPSRNYLDSLIGEASENAYFQVSIEHAIGIPEPIGAIS